MRVIIALLSVIIFLPIQGVWAGGTIDKISSDLGTLKSDAISTLKTTTGKVVETFAGPTAGNIVKTGTWTNAVTTLQGARTAAKIIGSTAVGMGASALNPYNAITGGSAKLGQQVFSTNIRQGFNTAAVAFSSLSGKAYNALTTSPTYNHLAAGFNKYISSAPIFQALGIKPNNRPAPGPGGALVGVYMTMTEKTTIVKTPLAGQENAKANITKGGASAVLYKMVDKSLFDNPNFYVNKGGITPNPNYSERKAFADSTLLHILEGKPRE